MAYESIAAFATYVYEAFAGASLAEGAGAAAEIGSAAAGSAGASTLAEAALTSSAASTSASTAATWATYAQVASAVLAGGAAYSSAQNQAEAAKFNAGMGESNAQLASMQAGAAEDAQRRKSALVLGEQRAAFAGSGVDPNSGTGLLVQEQSASNAELDALNIRYEGLLRGRGLLAQSQLDTRQASIYGQNANLALANTALSGTGAYLGGKGNYYKIRASGIGAGY